MERISGKKTFGALAATALLVAALPFGALAFAQPSAPAHGSGVCSSFGIACLGRADAACASLQAVCQRAGFVDANGDGICDNRGTGTGAGFVDADGNGVCDNRGTGNGAGTGNGNGTCTGNGAGFVDTDGNGVCDNRGTGTGAGVGFVDADGNGVCDNRGTGNGAGTGVGCGHNAAHGHGFNGCRR